ncbi:MAG: endolytic transglycosylase MltG [Candidatus Colwellbacteria bacterium]|nr:endolytic transglycosylase MltG [Candidatus Colwellbacteria bacterium]
MKRFIFFASVFSLLVIILSFWVVIRYRSVPETPRDIVTIPEGWTVSEINLYLKGEGVLADEELSGDLEGYLFPDTYEFFLDSTAAVVQQKFQDNFSAKLEEIGVDVLRSDLQNIIIVASLIEKEVQNVQDKRMVSGILWKRLQNEMPLQVDATICYIKDTELCLPITASDKEIDSEYNTYLYRGLPPGPICNPGADSILAAIQPEESPYWYYLSSGGGGRTIFARTLDEHRQNIIKYLNE